MPNKPLVISRVNVLPICRVTVLSNAFSHVDFRLDRLTESLRSGRLIVVCRSFADSSYLVSACLDSIFLFKISKALSGSHVQLNLATIFELRTTWLISESERMSILDIGARNIVCANGVGLAFSSNTVMSASPIPRFVIKSAELIKIAQRKILSRCLNRPAIFCRECPK